jgi:predicted  nucleic acid-binding Zn-ribbon protein
MTAPKANFNSKELNVLDRGIDSKVREMKEIDIKITETRGEIIRLEEKKGSVRKDLEALQARLAPIIDGIDRREPSGQSARAEIESNEIR